MSDFITLDLVWGLLNISGLSCQCLLRDKLFWTADERNIPLCLANYKKSQFSLRKKTITKAKKKSIAL